MDSNAKARAWAAAGSYNARTRQRGQHQGPLTWATLRVFRVLLWRFHDADGGGRCFPSYERIAAAAKCARSSVNVALRALEDAEPRSTTCANTTPSSAKHGTRRSASATTPWSTP